MAHTHDSQACRYRISIREQLDPRWAEWFEGMQLTTGPDGTTILAGIVRDQAALYGLLAKVRDLGLTLLAVEREDP